MCNESLALFAAVDPSNFQFEGIDCKEKNDWTYGLGFSQCTDSSCCNDGSCQFHCSLTTSWPGCVATMDHSSGHHSRICPCTKTAESSWVLAEQASGDCEAACSRVNKKCDEAMGKKAASNPNGEDFEGISCTERNQWYFGQGFSQCTDKSCGSRLHQCSITSIWPGCKTNGFFNNDHQDQSRICPCTNPKLSGEDRIDRLYKF